MELRHLNYFLAVAEELHFRKASEKLFIAQPALSRQIRQLEDDLGVGLFLRNKRSVKLTPAGKYFMKEVKAIFQSLESTRKTLMLIDSGLMGKIKIGYVGSAMHNVLPPIIAKIQKGFPELHTELAEMTSNDQVRSLSSGTIDVGFLRTPPASDGLQAKVVYEETFCIALPLTHPANAHNFKSLKDLAQDNFILLPRSAGEKYYDSLIRLCNKAGFNPKTTHESVYGSTIIRLVENNLGVAILPSSLMKGFNAKVKFIELKKISERSQLYVVWKKDNDSPALSTFLKIVDGFLHEHKIKRKT